MHDKTELLKKASEILDGKTPLLKADDLSRVVQSYLDRREIFIKAAQRTGSPLYIIEREALIKKARRFRDVFGRALDDMKVYYAIKSNNHPEIVKILTNEGLGLDVSSGLELKMALDAKADDIVFSGPGKTDDELDLAVNHTARVTVLIDSFGELTRLERAAEKNDIHIRAGVRLTTDERSIWRKFGIPLGDLERFFAEADSCIHIDLSGLQFHTSWNLNPGNQTAFIERLGATIKDWSMARREQIQFIDIGGGYWPPQGEWLQPAGTSEGKLIQALSENTNEHSNHHCLPAVPIDEFAREISLTLKKYIFPFIKCTIFLEPGRWICNDAMHILLKVVDKKAEDMIITDAGTNSIGWERFETDYFPVINLSRPGLEEHDAYILGSLCTPHDIWGYNYFGDGLEPGDFLLIPTQGAYTYSLRQNFIKPLPETIIT